MNPYILYPPLFLFFPIGLKQGEPCFFVERKRKTLARLQETVIFDVPNRAIVLGHGAVMVLTEENRLTVAVVW